MKLNKNLIKMDLLNSNMNLIIIIGLFTLFECNSYFVMANNSNLNILSERNNNNNNFEENSVLRDSNYNENTKNNDNLNKNKQQLLLLPPPPPPLLPSLQSPSSSSTNLKDTFSINDVQKKINNKDNRNINNNNNHSNKNNVIINDNNDNDDVNNLDIYDDNIDESNNNNNNNILVNNNNNNDEDDDDELSSSSTLSLSDQVHLLSKQLNALMIRRREDYKILENSLLKSLNKNLISNHNGVDGTNSMDIKSDLEEIRNEIKMLREGGSNSNKERLTVEWLTQSIAEMRKELTELQEIASNASADLNRRSQTFEDLATIKNDFKSFKLELEALKQRQETSEVLMRELKEESIQKEDDLRKMIRHQSDINNKANNDNNNNEYIVIEPSEADHRMRHQRFLRQQIHDLEISQHNLKRQLNELQYHRISDRVHNLEIEQRRLANANFNLSRQIVGLDKLHSSMLELLEDVEGIQNKMDKTIPDIKREISKLEFTSAQFNSEQNLLREEGHNVAKSIQAMAVSISALQDERDIIKDLQNSVQKLQQDVERLKSISNIQNSIVQRRIQKIETDANPNSDSEQHHIISNDVDNGHNNIQTANNLVQQLESVELQYESIINKLPSDCSQVDHKVNGLYLIAPSGQHRPILAYCNEGGWTTIQRRYDGSIDFNRSWESYAQGFGNPSGEFWIGNEIIHRITSDNCTQLKIIMQDIYDNVWEAVYKYFYVSSREDGYRLNVSGYYGNASDALDYQNKMQFSAIDVDRDISNTHCAANYEGGWWFSHCQHANLNGRYNLGLTWFDGSRNEWIAVKSSQIMVNKRQECYSYSNSSPMTTESSTTTITSVV